MLAAEIENKLKRRWLYTVKPMPVNGISNTKIGFATDAEHRARSYKTHGRAVLFVKSYWDLLKDSSPEVQLMFAQGKKTLLVNNPK